MGLTKKFAREFWFQLTLKLEMNSVPFAVNVKAPKPAVAFDGDKDVTARSGSGATIENVAALEVQPPAEGFVTVTE
jgi:hypothetical protein